MFQTLATISTDWNLPPNETTTTPTTSSSSLSSSTSKPKTPTQKFFEAYAHAVNTRTFTTTPMTKWYAPSLVFRSETLKEFRGPEEMAEWMAKLFLPFERVNHIAETYLEYEDSAASSSSPGGKGGGGEEASKEATVTVVVHATFLRQFWLQGNQSEVPDSSTPVAWHGKVGPAETEDGFAGLQWKEVRLFWDKTKIVGLIGRELPSDR